MDKFFFLHFFFVGSRRGHFFSATKFDVELGLRSFMAIRCNVDKLLAHSICCGKWRWRIAHWKGPFILHTNLQMPFWPPVRCNSVHQQLLLLLQYARKSCHLFSLCYCNVEPPYYPAHQCTNAINKP